jgi:hypothetical protein
MNLLCSWPSLDIASLQSCLTLVPRRETSSKVWAFSGSAGRAKEEGGGGERGEEEEEEEESVRERVRRRGGEGAEEREEAP